MIKSSYLWILKNGWNLFSVTGVIATFYFSIIYIPDYVKDISDSKISLARESLVSDVQEILFYSKKLEIQDIRTLIKAREIKIGMIYPQSAEDLLLEAQDRFISNKFIPLDRRQELMTTIKEILSRSTTEKITQKKETNWISILTFLLSSIGSLAAILGLKSLNQKVEADRETAIDISQSETFSNEETGAPRLTPYQFESMIEDILHELGVEFDANSKKEFDNVFSINCKNSKFEVEVKAHRQLLGLSTIRYICPRIAQPGRDGILIISSGLTKNAKHYIDRYNQTQNEKVHVILGSDKETIKEQLSEILNNQTTKQLNL